MMTKRINLKKLLNMLLCNVIEYQKMATDFGLVVMLQATFSAYVHSQVHTNVNQRTTLSRLDSDFFVE